VIGKHLKTDALLVTIQAVLQDNTEHLLTDRQIWVLARILRDAVEKRLRGAAP
jgi:hypothetical protein